MPSGAAAELQDKLGLSCVMVHLVGSAAAAGAGEAVACDGFLCEKPVITTGAGDHFNAGFTGLLDGLPLSACLLGGGATSGFTSARRGRRLAVIS